MVQKQLIVDESSSDGQSSNDILKLNNKVQLNRNWDLQQTQNALKSFTEEELRIIEA